MSSHLELPAILRLPHPYLTSYSIHQSRIAKVGSQWLQIVPDAERSSCGETLPVTLHNDISFTLPIEPDSRESPAASNNTFWARVRRSPKAEVRWDGNVRATIGQLWLIVYAVFTLKPELEDFRISMRGPNNKKLAEELKAVSLAIARPSSEIDASAVDGEHDELVIPRGTFWQGAGSPFGPRPVWAPDTIALDSAQQPLSSFPIPSLDYTTSTKFPKTRIHAFHPRRPQKPTPGSLIYSRYIPHLNENFSMVALNYTDKAHLDLFHKWQNDPRVSQGWNETGTLDQHRTYLRNLHEDAHVLTVLAAFDDEFFAYFEIYWAKVCSSAIVTQVVPSS